MLYSSHLDGAEEVGVVATEGGGVLLVLLLVGGERDVQGLTPRPYTLNCQRLD